MSRPRFQFSLKGMLGLTAVIAVASLLVAGAGRDPKNGPGYVMAAFAVLGAGAGWLSGSIARGCLVALVAYCVLAAAIFVLAMFSGLL